jgi:hypothetical protein
MSVLHAESANGVVNGFKLSFGRRAAGSGARAMCALLVSPRRDNHRLNSFGIRINSETMRATGWRLGDCVAVECEHYRGDVYFVVRRVPETIGVKLLAASNGNESDARAYFTCGEKDAATLFSVSNRYECVLMNYDEASDRCTFKASV